MKSIPGLIGMLLVWTLVLWAELGGLYHSYTKHNDVVLAFFIPPVAVYRSVEFFWHDDFKGVNWDKRLPNDIKACLYFLAEYAHEEANIVQLNKDLEEFSSIINKYPEDKRDYIKSTIDDYFIYNDLYIEAFLQSLKNWAEKKEELNLIKTNDISYYEKKFKEKGLGFIIEDVDNGFLALKEALNTNVTEEKKRYWVEKSQELIKSVELRMRFAKTSYKDTYKNIFN